MQMKRMIGSTTVISVLAGTALSQQPTQPTTHWADESGVCCSERFGRWRWALIDNVPASRTAGEAWVRPNMFNAAVLDTAAMRELLSAAPLEGTPDAERAGHHRPADARGRFPCLAIYESPVMEARSAEVPMIRTYAGQSLEDDTARVLTMTPSGFDAGSPRGLHAYIDRYSKNDDSVYAAYYKKDLDRSDNNWSCSHESIHGSPDVHGWAQDNRNITPPMRVSRRSHARNTASRCSAQAVRPVPRGHGRLGSSPPS